MTDLTDSQLNQLLERVCHDIETLHRHSETGHGNHARTLFYALAGFLDERGITDHLKAAANLMEERQDFGNNPTPEQITMNTTIGEGRAYFFEGATEQDLAKKASIYDDLLAVGDRHVSVGDDIRPLGMAVFDMARLLMLAYVQKNQTAGPELMIQ